MLFETSARALRQHSTLVITRGVQLSVVSISFAASLLACSSSSVGSGSAPNAAFDALFASGSLSAPTDTMEGVWSATAGQGEDVRLELESAHVTVAMRCFDGTTIGVTVAAAVTDESIRILESKTAGPDAANCGLSVVPMSLPACPSAEKGSCFLLRSGTLTLRGTASLFRANSTIGPSSFLKLGD